MGNQVTAAARPQVERILAGDPNAFKQLVKDHERLVGQVVFRMVRNDTDREDVCQDIFVKVYQNLGGFDSTPSCRPGLPVLPTPPA